MNNKETFKRIPKHIGIIPDGNRRWAVGHNMDKKDGYYFGIDPGFHLYETMIDYGIKEATFYGFTQDNTKRPSNQKAAFIDACIKAVNNLANRDANLLIVGNSVSDVFPKELLKYANKRVKFGKGLININFLVNYDWKWDLNNGINNIASSDISRIDLIIRWGGRRRLSGFLPVQSVYSDIYVIDEYWPDFKTDHFKEALRWYQTTDVTLGG
ncbi:dihydroorotate dehydrogenase [Vallitalea longa]|uniref:Dihydroorotate dehydrogenase n=1 Tax=Vallitalea longa TaxID=2936439 RepID=A0A9W5YI09_9FIRM|nr:undecaprenyl diphosphate synthase family protein [Vallitalea longa]GKX32289.1 dihydroorotate dehydrogenase [Vallitalea longa]